MTAIRIISAVLLILGASIVYGAKLVYKYTGLGKKLKKPESMEFETEEERNKYIEQRAVVTVKLAGLLIILPGIVLAFIAFK
jgi:hypothetical protein